MRNRTLQLFKYPLGMLLFITAAILSSGGRTVLPFGLFLFLCFFETVLLYTERRMLLDLRIIFTLSWLGGIALSTLKLSRLQAFWGTRMWVSVFLFYFLVLLADDLLTAGSRSSGQITPGNEIRPSGESQERFRKKLLSCIWIILALGMASFITEAIFFKGEIPILSDKPHAYTAFHITGIHYFIVTMIFVPVLSVLYLFSGPVSRKEVWTLLAASGSVFLVYVLILSKLQLVFTAVMPAMAALLLQRRFRTRTVFFWFLALILVLVAGVLVLMSMRHYPEGYLEGIFRFKDKDTPAAIQYVYTYIVNNFENLNLLTVNLGHYSLGIRQLFPVFALTGAKFLPQVAALLSVEQYLTIEELTTLTILYDAYGDFGIAGAAGFGILLGLFNGYAAELFRRKRNVTSVLLYVQLAVYMGLAFFSTWFSNPTTWFWLAATVLITLWMCKEGDGFRASVLRTLQVFRLPVRSRKESEGSE